MTDIQVGDKVQLTAVVEAGDGGGKVIFVEGHGWIPALGFEVVEKAKPPVVTFKPGDVVRNIRSKMIYTIGENGRYFFHQGQRWNHASDSFTFTSRGYELVE